MAETKTVYTFPVVCENSSCHVEGTVVNVIEVPNYDDIELLLEAWGHGSEEESDYCPVCSELGTIYDIEEFTQKYELPMGESVRLVYQQAGQYRTFRSIPTDVWEKKGEPDQKMIIDPKKAPPIPDEAKLVAQPLINTFNNLALMSGFYKGEEVTYVCTALTADDGDTIFRPLFIIVTPEMHDNCGDTYGEPLSGGEDENPEGP